MEVQAIDQHAISITELARRVKGVIDGAAALQDVWVKGEISNFKHATSGHMYFTLKDDGSRVRCVMFRRRSHTVAFRPEDGQTVLVRGSVSVYETAGDVQLYVDEMHPAGQGALFLALQQLKERLEKEGLFTQRRPLPFLPRTVGLITSPTGAAVRDMISVIRRRNPKVNILLIPAVVQGEAAVPSLCAALDAARQQSDIDVLIIGRGGGSLEELWAFNEEALARALYACPIPTISAVGHETDFTIADWVADHRAATPSAAAETAVPELRALESALGELQQRAASALTRQARAMRQRLTLLASSAALTRPDHRIRAARQHLDEQAYKAELAVSGRVEKGRRRLEVVVGKLESLSPLATLARGYAICSRAGTGEVVHTAAAVAPGERLDVRVAQGVIPCKVVKAVSRSKSLPQEEAWQSTLPIE